MCSKYCEKYFCREQENPSSLPSAGGGERERATRRRRGGDASFDTNMGDHLAALRCALIFALGANSMPRCALPVRAAPRRGGRLAAGGVGVVAAARGGLKRARSADPGGGCTAAAAAAPDRRRRGGGGGGECAICLGSFARGEVRVLPRRHGFHVRCIDTWLAAHSSCPRAELAPPYRLRRAGAGAGAAGAEGR
ncbi:RING-H2 finger protein ATL74-like [Ananas comosus]|uniref:RING-H2 finger protein ATL74-like n=1 Tax=Ananas comosus TaxID=4615 RepID=A0A6P5H031_ANACO|nr:RING-H2 finger protein ATL74-like [Ananas comosus]